MLCYYFVDMATSNQSKDRMVILEKEGKLTGMTDVERRALAFGIAFYGENFWRYTLASELLPNVAAFKEFYINHKLADPKAQSYQLIREFAETIAPDNFFPRPNTYLLWRTKWDKEVAQRRGDKAEERAIEQVIETKNAERRKVPTMEGLEAGAQHLGGMLVNDAISMLEEDQQIGDAYEPDELIKRRGYILNVYNFVMKSAANKQAIELKRRADARETAGFLMDLMGMASAGKLDAGSLSILETAVPIHKEATEVATA